MWKLGVADKNVNSDKGVTDTYKNHGRNNYRNTLCHTYKRYILKNNTSHT